MCPVSSSEIKRMTIVIDRNELTVFLSRFDSKWNVVSANQSSRAGSDTPLSPPLFEPPTTGCWSPIRGSGTVPSAPPTAAVANPHTQGPIHVRPSTFRDSPCGRIVRPPPRCLPRLALWKKTHSKRTIVNMKPRQPLTIRFDKWRLGVKCVAWAETARNGRRAPLPAGRRSGDRSAHRREIRRRHLNSFGFGREFKCR